jgi:predicted Zn-dependent protease
MVTQLARAKKLPDARKKAADFTEARLKDYANRLEERKFPNEKNPDQARKKLLDDGRWQADLLFAQAFLRGQQFAEGESRLKDLLKQNPDQVAALKTLGDIYLQRKEWQQAVAVYQRVLDKEKGDFVAGNNLAWTLAVEMNEPKKALEVLRSVSRGRFSGKMLPGDRLHREVLDTLGVIYQKLYNTEDLHREMADIFEAGQKRYPRDARLYLYLGLAYAGLKDATKASQSLQTAIAMAQDRNNSTITDSQRANVLRDAEAARKRLPKK